MISTQAGTFTINKEDHTVGNLLRMQLLRDGDTRFAGYQLPHPLEHVCHVKVETTPGRAPVEVMGAAVTDLRQEVELLDRGFAGSVQCHNAAEYTRRVREPLSDAATVEPKNVALLNLSGQRLGAIECGLLAAAMSRGLLRGVTTFWLQANLIDESALRSLERGLRAMPCGRCGRLADGFKRLKSNHASSVAQEWASRELLAGLQRQLAAGYMALSAMQDLTLTLTLTLTLILTLTLTLIAGRPREGGPLHPARSRRGQGQRAHGGVGVVGAVASEAQAGPAGPAGIES